MLPSKYQLGGLSYEKAALFGMPHVGAAYHKGGYKLTQSYCCICGAPASNCHHVVPRSVRNSFDLITDSDTFSLRSPLFALCGSGTTGCHNGFHGGAWLKARWVWDSQASQNAWWNGLFLRLHKAHSPFLYCFGHWEIENSKTGELIRITGNEVMPWGAI